MILKRTVPHGMLGIYWILMLVCVVITYTVTKNTTISLPFWQVPSFLAGAFSLGLIFFLLVCWEMFYTTIGGGWLTTLYAVVGGSLFFVLDTYYLILPTKFFYLYLTLLVLGIIAMRWARKTTGNRFLLGVISLLFLTFIFSMVQGIEASSFWVGAGYYIVIGVVLIAVLFLKDLFSTESGNYC